MSFAIEPVAGTPFFMKTSKNTYILGIESSCDDTGAAVVQRESNGNGKILSNVVRSQIEEHLEFGGVVPELAARAHVIYIDQVIERAIKQSGIELEQIDAIAATAGPGLIGGVLVGLTTAKAMCAALDKPLIGINHLEAHALSARLGEDVEFPYLLLLVSGGHTQFLLVRGVGDYQLWGTSIDDALGEAFDKVAKMLGLGYPGGPAVERLAVTGDAKRFNFPRPLLKRKTLDFSFSGLKTAVRLAAEKIAPLSEEDVADICAGFQASVCDIIKVKTGGALFRYQQEIGADDIKMVVAGGVAANKAISQSLQQVISEFNGRLIVPPMELCTDNGAMVAWAGAERFALGCFDGLDLAARARWPLDEPSMKVAIK